MPDRPRPVPVIFDPFPHERGTDWQPAVDIYRVRGGWLLKFDVAGVDPGEISIRIDGCRVTIAGVRRDWVVEEVLSQYLMEIAYSRFHRTVSLPCELEDPSFRMDFRDGILLVRLSERGDDRG